MAEKWVYPDSRILHLFIDLLKSNKYSVSKYLPPTGKEWFLVIGDCISYVEQTSVYEGGGFLDCCARLLYKVAKRHELGDGNKRSSVIAVYLFCLLNDYIILSPKGLKVQAKRVARTKGRENEEMMKKRVAKSLEKLIEHLP